MKLLSLPHLLRHKPVARHQWLQQLGSPKTTARIVKKQHYSESYQRYKLATSIHNVCQEVSGFTGAAELTAEQVCHEVESWLEDKYEVTSADIRRRAAEALKHYHPVAAYAYAPVKEHRVSRDQYGFIRL